MRVKRAFKQSQQSNTHGVVGAKKQQKSSEKWFFLVNLPYL